MLEPDDDTHPPHDTGAGGADPQEATNTLAVLALTCSIVLAPLGIVLGILGLRQAKQRGQAGRGFALAGLCIGGSLTLVGVTAVVAIAAVRPQAEARVARSSAATPSTSADAAAQSGGALVSLACQEIVPAIKNTATELQHDLSTNGAVTETSGLMSQINSVAGGTADASFKADVAAVGLTLRTAVDQISTTRTADLSTVQAAIGRVVADCARYMSLPPGTEPTPDPSKGMPSPSRNVPVPVPVPVQVPVQVPVPVPVPQISVSVLFEITDWDTAMNDCVGVGQYSDLHPGTAVTITGQNGAVLGSSSLGQGRPGTGGGCSWVVRFGEVPADKAPLAVQVGQRGVVPLTPSDTPGTAYNFQASLGG